ncbi:MAG: hypothetical protein IKV24_03840 [Bacteroidaceae bacterium]|nr:hypothetical protein [Bacteroidaceae bacterium]
MKRNPKTKIKVSDNSPVMHCRAIRRRKMNGSTDNKAWGVGATLIPKEKVDIEDMGAISQQRCTVTQADVMAAWSMLEVIIADALANGRRVELGELGILSLDVRAKQLKEPGERLRATDLEVGSISFKPGPLLQQQLRRVTFKIDNDCPEPTDAESLDMALYKHFAEDGHEGINVREFARLSGYRETSARILLKEYIAQGVMEHVPMSRGYYRPTKGNFGRE